MYVLNDPNKFLIVLLHMSTQNTQNFTLISVEVIEKFAPRKSYILAQNYCKLVVYKRTNTNFAHFFAYNFFVSKFFAFYSTVSKSA